MLHLELNAADLNGIVSAASTFPKCAVLSKLDNFYIGNDYVSFDQDFMFNTNVTIRLSCSDGKILIRIFGLTDNILQFFLTPFHNFATKKIESVTGGMLQKVSSDCLMFDPRQLPLKPQIRSLAVREGKIVLDATV